MDKEKTMALLLLDLTAFALAQSEDESSRCEFEAACRLVEKDSPFDALVYRAQLPRAERRVREGNGAWGQRRSWPPRGHSTPAVAV